MMYDLDPSAWISRTHQLAREASHPRNTWLSDANPPDPQHSETSRAVEGLTSGWLIERSGGPESTGNRDITTRRFLQIGTGQWCGAEYATLFPMRRTAIAYAREFGLLAEHEAQIVRYEA